MDKKPIFKTRLLPLTLALIMTAIISLIMTRKSSESYSYELGSPWRYPLLTAQFDIPMVRDTATVRQMRDSIDRHYVPFVKIIDDRGHHVANEVAEQALPYASPGQINSIKRGILEVYARGVVSSQLFDRLKTDDNRTLRTIDDGHDGYNTARIINADEMMTPRMAFDFIDTTCRIQTANDSVSRARAAHIRAILNTALQPNVELDTVADSKFRNQEYLNVTSAIGIIKKGQRIVDRGEIITPQVMTNLDTYMDMLKRQQDSPDTFDFEHLAQVLYIALMVATLFLFFKLYRPAIFSNTRKMVFLTSYLTLFIVGVAIVARFNFGLFLIPYAMVPVVILVFTDSRTAIFSLVMTVLITSLIATYQFAFIVTEICVGLFATYSLRQLSRRTQLLQTALISFAAYCVCYLLCRVLTQGDLMQIDYKIFGTFAINSVILSFAYILIVVIEKIFGFTSAVTLVELGDINSPALRRLAEEAPGTFQHSMQVSALAAEAARAIGANALLVRTGALYHDIGKLESPVFYTENQHGVNPHAGLEPETSARKIISHVTAGQQLAAKYKLPQSIRDFIAEHHGRGVTGFFYNTAVNQSPNGKVDKAAFTYPGPNPQSKETAILMMADAVEAASRSLKEYSPEAIGQLVDNIISQQTKEGLFNDSPLAFNELQTIKDTFKKRLGTIYHTRVQYPGLKRPQDSET